MFFKREVVKYQVVEVEKGSAKLPEITNELKESLRGLQHSPAFNYILSRLRFQRAAMETTLREGLQLTETQIRFLQAGIYWASSIDKDISKLTQTSVVPRASTDKEEQTFAEIQRNMELVGV